MICKRCGKSVPRTTICNHCHQKTGHSLSGYPKCEEDMYGNAIKEIPIDLRKSQIRDNYLTSLPEYQKLRLIQGKHKQTDMARKKLVLIFVAIFTIAMIVGVLDSLGFDSGFFGILLVIAVTAFIVGICSKNIRVDKEMKFAEQQIKLHNAKPFCYANQFIIGYSQLHHFSTDDDGKKIFYYSFHEVDKRNIHGIVYDSKFAEYVLLLKTPVYVHDDIAPVKEFRIQDVFDDSVLTEALNCTLPPKNIPF